MYFLQFSFERFLANTRLHLLRVKGPSVNYISPLCPLYCFTFVFDFWTLLYLLELLLHSCSSLPLSLSLSALCHLSISLNLLSFTLHIWPSLYLDIPATGRSFSLFVFVFLCSPLPFDKGVHDSMTLWGLSPLLTVKCTNKSTDDTLRAVCIANIVSVLSSRGMQFITLTES